MNYKMRGVKIMKNFLKISFLSFFFIAILLVIFFIKEALAEKGEVVYQEDSCRYLFIGELPSGYALLRLEKGKEPHIGDIIAGDFSNRVLEPWRDIYNVTANSELRVYIISDRLYTNLWDSLKKAIVKYHELCH